MLMIDVSSMPANLPISVFGRAAAAAISERDGREPAAVARRRERCSGTGIGSLRPSSIVLVVVVAAS